MFIALGEQKISHSARSAMLVILMTYSALKHGTPSGVRETSRLANYKHGTPPGWNFPTDSSTG
jgi:hypothetical protein